MEKCYNINHFMGLYFTYEELKRVFVEDIGRELGCLYFTYEELKPRRTHTISCTFPGLYFTYEELKPGTGAGRGKVPGVCILPMRN